MTSQTDRFLSNSTENSYASVVLTHMNHTHAGRTGIFQRLQDRAQWRANPLLSGRFEDMSREYLFPLPVYLGSRLIAICDAEAGMAQAAALRRRQVETLTITVKALDCPRGGRFRIWAKGLAVAQDGSPSLRLGLIYSMRETRAGYRSEMLQYSAPRRAGCRSMTPPLRQKA